MRLYLSSVPLGDALTPPPETKPCGHYSCKATRKDSVCTCSRIYSFEKRSVQPFVSGPRERVAVQGIGNHTIIFSPETLRVTQFQSQLMYTVAWMQRKGWGGRGEGGRGCHSQKGEHWNEISTQCKLNEKSFQVADPSAFPLTQMCEIFKLYREHEIWNGMINKPGPKKSIWRKTKCQLNNNNHYEISSFDN